IDTVAAASLRFLILTAARTGEVIGARWNEVDWNERTWTVPAVRAKTKRNHVVPLSAGALAILREIESLRSCADDFIFPGRDGAGQSSMTLLALLQRRMKRAASVHGFRSCFRDFCGDEAGVPRELAEAALAHSIRDATERAYRRKTAVEKRRGVMQSWCDYCLPSAPTGVGEVGGAGGGAGATRVISGEGGGPVRRPAAAATHRRQLPHAPSRAVAAGVCRERSSREARKAEISPKNKPSEWRFATQSVEGRLVDLAAVPACL